MIKVLLTTSAFTLIFMVSASAQDATRRGDRRFMAEQQRFDSYEPVVNLSRTVAADQKLRLDFLYSINPDCTSIGFATVRVLEQPKHGTIAIANDTGYTNVPARNPRAECNKRRSDGVAVTYQPEPGYTGTDSISLDSILPSGFLSKRHYTVDVR